MRVVACLVLAALHSMLAVAFTGIALDGETSLPIKLVFGITAVAVWLAAGLLAARPFVQLPSVVVTIFRGWCITLPALYFIASMDSGMISGQELLLGLFVTGFSWLAWRTFSWAKPPGSPTEQANA